MKIYISTRGDATGIIRAKALAAQLEALGHTITFKWWASVEAERAKGRQEEDLSPAERWAHSWADFEGVRSAELLVYLEPHEKSEGAAWEHGAAWMARTLLELPCVVVVGARRAFIFSELCDFRLGNEDELLDRLGSLADEVARRRGLPCRGTP